MRRRARVVVAWLVSAVVVAGAGFVAGRATLAPPDAPAELVPSAVYTVQSTSVGRSSSFRVDVTWPTRPAAFGPGPGTVTSVDVEPGAPVAAGEVLFRVDQRPVVLAQGEVPAFRDLGEGDVGADVAQLQRLLRDAGLLTGQADGTFGGRTSRAVHAWQRGLGVPATGTVRLGDVVFAPETEARVVLGPDVLVGGRVDDTTPTVDVVVGEPRLEIVVDGTSTVPAAGTPVVVTYLDGRWSGAVGPVVPADEDGAATRLALVADGGGPLCASECASIPLAPGPGALVAEVEVVPSVTGPTVPVSALGQGVDGQVLVTLSSGREVPVTVLVTDGSRAVVDGVEPGAEILLPSGDLA